MTPFMTDIALLKPELFMACSAMLLLILGAFRGNHATGTVMGLAIVAMLVTIGELIMGPAYMTRTLAFHDIFITDAFAVSVKVLCLVGLILALMMSFKALRQDMMERFEYPVLVMLSGIGMMIMVSAHDFLGVYVGLELSSLPLYVLAAFRRETTISAEAGMKYFVLGALSSGMLLFGISLVYGFAGSTNFATIHDFTTNLPDGTTSAGLIVGMAFILAGLAFKVSAVPFHMWTPDVYQGAPGAVTALFAMVPKIAALAMLIRILFHPFGAVYGDWVQIIAFLSAASMIWGSIAAVRQTNIKRLLAYGSIANIGYAMMGLVVVSAAGLASSLLYMGIYLLMTAGAFAVLLTLRRDDVMMEEINDLAGLSHTRPVMAYILAIMMFAMAGIPPLAGFFSKLMVFNVVVASGFYALAILGVIVSVVAAYYYLNVIRVMFFKSSNETLDSDPDFGQQLVALFAVVAVVTFVLSPEAYYHRAQIAADALIPSASAVEPAAP